MSLMGCSCLVLTTAGQWRINVIRAASQPLLSNSDLTHIRVLVEWCEGGGIGETQREWVNLTNQELFKCVYIEKSLLWARRVLATEQNRAVAWPARAFMFLCGTPSLSSPDMLIAEYFCDKEKMELFIHETKELQLAEAKATLSQQAQMLQELREWEEISCGRDLLQNSSSPLNGCRISVCNIQQPLSWIDGIVTSHNLQTKELTLVEDHSQAMHTVNPLMVHVLLHTFPDDGHGMITPQRNQNSTWQTPPPPLSLVNSPDMPPTNSPVSINSPHLKSPVIQECLSPHLNLNSSSNKSPLSLYRSPSQDIPPSSHHPFNHFRRSSLQQSNISIMRSEPNLHRRCSLDPITLQRLSDPFDFISDLPHSHSNSLGKIPFHTNSSPTDRGGTTSHSLTYLHSSPHGSNSQLSMHGSNTQLNTQHGSNSQLSTHGSNSQLSTHGSNPQLSNHGSNSSLSGDTLAHSGGFPTPEDIIKQTDRSKSVGNLFSCIQTQPLGYQQRQQEQASHVSGGGGGGGGGVRQIPKSLPPLPLSSRPAGLPGGGLSVSASTLQNSQTRKRQKNFAYAKGAIKKPRFEVMPTISDPQDISSSKAQGEDGLAMSVVSKLCRSASQPAVFPPRLLEKRLKQLTGGTGVFTGGEGTQKHEDDLDIIKQIIETDISMHSVDPGDDRLPEMENLRTQSLDHIPGQFISAGSLPSLPHAESMHVLHANYNSAPDFLLFGKPRASSLHPVGGGGEGSYNAGNKEPGPLTHNSHTRSSLDGYHSPNTNLSYSPFSGQDDLAGSRKSFDSQSHSRHNSLFESHSAASTPVFANDGSQNTPQGVGRLFNFAHQPVNHQSGYHGVDSGNITAIADNRSTSLSAEDYGPSSIQRWNGAGLSGDNPNLSNAYRIAPSETLSSTPSSSDKDGFLGANNRRQSENDSGPPPTTDLHMLSDYLTGGGRNGQENPSDLLKSRNSDDVPNPLKELSSLPDVATEAVILAPSVTLRDQDGSHVDDLVEFSISKEINRQFPGEDSMDDTDDLLYNMEDQNSSNNPATAENSSSSANDRGSKPKKTKKSTTPKESTRNRGRPRLTEEEKQRRKELRELGLMKRSKRRTKEQVAQWRAEKILSPAKRGRKPGSGKKNIIKIATGKVVFVSLDLSQYINGTILLQNGFCRAYPGVSKCLDCGTCEGDLPSSKYCRFLEFRKLCIEDNVEPRVSVHGFADYKDVVAQDLVPWTPLKTSYSGMDESTALFILCRVMPNFMAIVTEQAKTLPDTDVLPVWKRAVNGIRELCDTCDTSLFNFHWVCRSCGFCICPACYSLAYNSEDDVEAVSSMEGAAWPSCVSSNQPHRPANLILAQIIPANVLSDVVVQALAICRAHKIQVSAPSVLQRLMPVLSQQIPQSKYQNEPNKKSKGQATTPTHNTQLPHHLVPDGSTPAGLSSLSPAGPPALNPVGPSSLNPVGSLSLNATSFLPCNNAPSTPLSLSFPHGGSSLLASLTTDSIELPHSCSNGNEELSDPPPMMCPHQWLCDGTLLYLLDAKHSENITAFQERWKRGEPVVVSGVDRYLDKSLWTPQAFERDFGDELADLMDCRLGIHLPQLPCRTFWAGFEDMSVRLKDPMKDEPRLLKLKDWPPGCDFSEKLPRRYNDLMNALPLPDYTKRDGRYNMASSLPNFFVKPDLGPKMYNAYGSPSYPSYGTTNLHLDISSAVNVMVYCNVPPSVAEKEWKMIDNAVSTECCPETYRRIKETGAKVGAIWHIYSASDADKIRALLKKVYEETGMRLQMGSDPIHDQLVYLDSDLRQRLYREYGVKGWTIAQCVGDAIFIPAGAPHQVRNLCSCIKIAEDFVSPEHVYECLKLTEEFRQLSDHHANHEDKLQVKNIIYHSVKDIVGALKSSIK